MILMILIKINVLFNIELYTNYLDLKLLYINLYIVFSINMN